VCNAEVVYSLVYNIHGGSSLLIDNLGSYVTASTKVRKEAVEKAMRLGISISEFLRRKLEKEVKRREVELISRRLSELGEVLDAIDIERVVRHV
jgi:LytS/YehU family sensor histidine kinase